MYSTMKDAFWRHAPRPLAQFVLQTKQQGERMLDRRPIRLGWSLGHNFGDSINPLIVGYFTTRPVRHSHFPKASMVAIGSVLEMLEESENNRSPVVWGSGFLTPGPPWQGPPVRIAALRGKLTRERMAKVAHGATVPLGDPALLVSRVFPELRTVPTRYTTTFIPHYADADSEKVHDIRRRFPHVNIVDVTQPTKFVLEQIAASRLVLSSSLHGLICADGLEVPNVWTPFSDNLTGGSYKFRDYYSAFDAAPHPIDVVEAITAADALADAWIPPSSLNRIQEELIEAFPRWEFQTTAPPTR